MPFRILNKGPEYFRRPAEPGARRPSAVERLEADKAKYVKSQRVASTRQEPVKPPLLKQPLFAPGVRRALLSPGRKAPHRGEPGGPKTSLDLEILNNLINVCDSPLRAAEGPEAAGAGGHAAAPRPPGPAAGKAPESSAGCKPPGAVAVRRVDVRPCGAPRAGAPPAVPPSPGPDGARRQTPLPRSKSDLSDRYSRATADLERFFNYCGLDAEEVRDLGAERFARAASDIVSAKPQSGSTASSGGGRSQRSAGTRGERQPERLPYGISVVERNARVIKWLYGLRQAREPQQVSSV
ncbi:protein FAM110A isoform X1 [Dromaius novaehollandiae]|uniref:protein FAM110A isoform X1 n=1 Tax=Dromaius novaehollandiae TaxID=8790 RepID=UPI00312037D6